MPLSLCPSHPFPVPRSKYRLQRGWGRYFPLRPLAEGLASQAFRFRQGAVEYVVRVNELSEGFRKGLVVSRRFAAPTLPIPRSSRSAAWGGGQAFCVSRRAPGVRLHDLDAARLARMAAPVARVMAAVAAAGLEGTSGFGRFDAGGAAPYANWRAFLGAPADSCRFDWGAAGRVRTGQS